VLFRNASGLLASIDLFLNTQREERPSAPKKGRLKAQSQAIYRDLNHDGFNLSLPN
jgi:hypothetical protein